MFLESYHFWSIFNRNFTLFFYLFGKVYQMQAHKIRYEIIRIKSSSFREVFKIGGET